MVCTYILNIGMYLYFEHWYFSSSIVILFIAIRYLKWLLCSRVVCVECCKCKVKYGDRCGCKVKYGVCLSLIENSLLYFMCFLDSKCNCDKYHCIETLHDHAQMLGFLVKMMNSRLLPNGVWLCPYSLILLHHICPKNFW